MPLGLYPCAVGVSAAWHGSGEGCSSPCQCYAEGVYIFVRILPATHSLFTKQLNSSNLQFESFSFHSSMAGEATLTGNRVSIDDCLALGQGITIHEYHPSTKELWRSPGGSVLALGNAWNAAAAATSGELCLGRSSELRKFSKFLS